MIDLQENRKISGLGEVLKLSWPASLTMLNSTLIRFVDGWMVSRVGPAPFSAQLLASLWCFVPESFVIGMLTVVNTYVSQNFGAGNLRRTARYAWAGILLALGFAALMSPLALVARPIFAQFQNPADPSSPQILALEVMYFRYMILSVALALSVRPLEQFFFGVHRPVIVLAASIVANAFNVLANYTLIFGKFGFPALGLQGAAIGSIMAWGLQLVLLLGVFLSPWMHRKFGTRFVRTVRWRQCKELLSLGWPAGLQLGNDILCWSVFLAVLVSRAFGTVHLTASTVAMRYLGLSFMPAIGIGIATTALVGRFIGAEKPHLARQRTHAALLAGMIYMGLCGLGFYVFRYPMVSAFIKVVPSTNVSPAEAQRLAGEIIQVGANILICAAVFQLFDAIGIVYIGALRGAGDTRWPMVVTLLLSWGIIVGVGSVVIRFFPQWTSIGPWVVASVYVVALGFVMACRFESGAWRKIDLLARRRPVSVPLIEHPPLETDVISTIPSPDEGGTEQENNLH
jgi:MATE family multidrug resistance protein